jgi:hypothetical protein
VTTEVKISALKNYKNLEEGKEYTMLKPLALSLAERGIVKIESEIKRKAKK